MRTLLNVLWLVCGGGLILGLEYLLGGLLLCLTVVGIPFGVQCIKLGGLALWPFGKDVVDERASLVATPLSAVMNVVWFLVAGVWIFLTHVALALGLVVSIVGIPFAFQHMKFAVFALTPFGRRVVAVR